MALDFKAIRTTVIETIQLAIGPLLSQQFNPVLQQSYGTVFNARPNPELPVPTYPYAVVDITSSEDTDWFLTNLVHDLSTDKWQWETHKTVSLQISIFGGDAIQIGETLKTAYRRDDVLEILINGDIALADVQTTQILPELIQTDWLEVSFLQLTIRVNDIFIDQNLQSVESVILDGELTGSLSSDPIEIHIDTTGFIWTINTELPGSASDSYELPLTETAGYDARVYWGDGSFDNITDSAPILHQYAIPGIYDIQMVGVFPELIFNAGEGIDFDKITDIKQWGGNQWVDVEFMFDGCSNLGTLSATDIPNLTGLTSLRRMFRECVSFNGGPAFADWDISNITNLNTMFSGAFDFNTSIDNWNVTKVEDFFGMFANCTSYNQGMNSWVFGDNIIDFEFIFINCTVFNGAIDQWDVSKLTELIFTFRLCRDFNQDISSWDTSNVTTTQGMFFQTDTFNQDISSWDMSSNTNIENMFFEALAFNQPIGIWDLSNVFNVGANNIDSCFDGANAFNQDLTNWPWGQWLDVHDMFLDALAFNQDVSGYDISSMTNMDNMFSGTAMDTTNYDLLLNAWSLQAVQTGVPFGTSATYTIATSQAARDILTINNSWSITDGGGI